MHIYVAFCPVKFPMLRLRQQPLLREIDYVTVDGDVVDGAL